MLKGADNQIDNESDSESDNEIDKRELVLSMLWNGAKGGILLAGLAGGLYLLSYGDLVSMGLETGKTILFGLAGVVGGAIYGAVKETGHIPAQAVRNTTDYCVDGVCKLADRVLPAPKKKKAAKKSEQQQPAAEAVQPATNATRGADDSAPKNGTVINNYFQAPVSTVYASEYQRQQDAAAEEKKVSRNSSARTRGYSPARRK